MTKPSPARFDAIVIGAGFSGLYALHRLRKLGVQTLVLETADDVGGTWLFNRYPGARCDIESIEYSYSFSDEIQQEWVWTETMPAQPEIEAYLNFVADRLDLRRDIRFDTTVVAMTFDEAAAEWLLDTATGEQFVRAVRGGRIGHPVGAARTRHRRDGHLRRRLAVSPAAGRMRAIDFTGKRVGVIGTGSTGVQTDPRSSRKGRDHLTVFQRSPAYTLPWQVRAVRRRRARRAEGELRRDPRRAAGAPVGAARLSAPSRC